MSHLFHRTTDSDTLGDERTDRQKDTLNNARVIILRLQGAVRSSVYSSTEH